MQIRPKERRVLFFHTEKPTRAAGRRRSLYSSKPFLLLQRIQIFVNLEHVLCNEKSRSEISTNRHSLQRKLALPFIALDTPQNSSFQTKNVFNSCFALQPNPRKFLLITHYETMSFQFV